MKRMLAIFITAAVVVAGGWVGLNPWLTQPKPVVRQGDLPPGREQSAVPAPRSDVNPVYAELVRRGMPADMLLLDISIHNQYMSIIDRGELINGYSISTSKFGVGSQFNSNQTPLGVHRVSNLIGDGAVPGTVFVSRRQTSRVIPESKWRSMDGKDVILTRVITLQGLEPGINKGGAVDSEKRGIYIHGTDQEQLMGTPSSHGCIRMLNRQVIELFDLLKQRPAWCVIRAD